jgi:hypothetical protein
MSKEYLKETQELCKNIMENRVLCFTEIEYFFDFKSLRARRKEIESVDKWEENKLYREYYVSLLKLTSHYLFPMIKNKFDIWVLLNNR